MWKLCFKWYVVSRERYQHVSFVFVVFLANQFSLFSQHKEKEDSDPDALVEKVFKVLYATADQKVTVDEDGEIVDVQALEEELGLLDPS